MTTSSTKYYTLDQLVERGYDKLVLEDAWVYRRDDFHPDYCAHAITRMNDIIVQCKNVPERGIDVDGRYFCHRHLKKMLERNKEWAFGRKAEIGEE